MNEDKMKKHTNLFHKYKKKKMKKSKKKKKQSSSDSDSEGSEVEWVEAPPPEQLPNKEKKKKLKKKKKKKHTSSDSESKKHKKRKHASSTSDTTESENEDQESSEASPNKIQREDWMNEETFVPTLSKNEMLVASSQQKRTDALRKKREEEANIHQARELNPYLKKDLNENSNKNTVTSGSSSSSTLVGDGGYSWLKKAYYRILEQSQREGRSMEEIAAERWGSLDSLLTKIHEAEEKLKNSNFKQDGHDRKWNENVKSFKSNSLNEFRKPQDNAKKDFEFRREHKFQKPNDRNAEHRSNSPSFSSSSDFRKYPTTDFKQKLDTSSHIPAWKKQTYESSSAKHVPTWKKSEYVKENEKKNDKSSDLVSIVNAETSHASLEDSIKSQKNMSDEENAIVNIESEDDLNFLAAKYLKAEIKGNLALASKLKKELEEAKTVFGKSGGNVKRQVARQQKEVILTKLDSSGQAHPLQKYDRDKFSAGPSKQKGRKNKYFDDDSSYSLKQMFEREKLTTTSDHMEMFMDIASGQKEISEMDYEKDDMSKLSKKMSHSRQEEKDIAKAIREHQHRSTAVEKCHYCLDEPSMKRYLIVSIEEKAYLCLPNYQCLVEGHCLIVPKQHVSSLLHLDEDEWREIEDLKKSVRKFFHLQNKSVIFLETSMNFRYFPHAFLECIPVPEEDGHMGPFYFKKAIQESEMEWSHNKKLVDLKNKGLRHSIPRTLPYFCVEFDPKIHAGFAHVIEEEKYFPRNFGKEVVGGMLDINYNNLYKNRREDPIKIAKEVHKFEKQYNKFKSEHT